jgi:hypothetical protein
LRGHSLVDAAISKERNDWVSGHGEDHEVNEERRSEEDGDGLQEATKNVSEHNVSLGLWSGDDQHRSPTDSLGFP